MRPTRLVTAMLLLAAFVLVGCSKGSETSKTKVQSPTSAQAKPVLDTREPLATNGIDEEGYVSAATPRFTGAVSFADGEAAYHGKKYGDAAAIFEAYTDRRPGNAWGHYMLGLSAWKSGDFMKSETAFDKALNVDPRHLKSLVNSGRLFIDQKRYDEAIDRLTRAAEIDPASPDVNRLLARTYRAQGRTDEAVEVYRQAIELNELDAWSMNNLGLLFLETQRADEALPLLMKAVELRKDVPEFHNNLGMVLEHAGRFKAAADAYSGALLANPRHEKAKQNLARVEAVKGAPEGQ